MKLFDSNPYRVLGIKANASAPEKQKATAKIAAYITVGKDPILDFDLCPPLKQITRTQELIDLKSNTIHSDEDKVKHALFWFVSGGTIDDIALSNLTKSKDIHKALSNFEKGAKNFAINKSSICSIVNHSTLEIICYPQYKDRNRLKYAISQKLKIASSDNYLSMLLSHLNPNNKNISSSSIKADIIRQCKELLIYFFKYTNEEKLYLEFFSDQKEIVEDIKEKKNNLLIDSIKNYLALAKHNREKILREDYGVPILTKCTKIGFDIIDRCIPSLIQIKESYGVTHNLTQNIYNEVFSEVNLCCITAANKFGSQYHDYQDQLNFIKTAGRTCHKCYIDLLQSCQIHLSYLRIPIKGTIEKNIEVMNNSYRNWQQLYDDVLREEERERHAEIERQRRARQRREQEKRDRIRRERERIERAERERKERIRRERIRREKQKEKEDREFAIIIGALILGAIILFALFGWTALIIILIIIGIFAGGR